MFYRLSNNDNPNVTFGVTSSTWYGILELAEENGWNPMGTLPPDPDGTGLVLAGLGYSDAGYWGGEYWSDEGGLVLL